MLAERHSAEPLPESLEKALAAARAGRLDEACSLVADVGHNEHSAAINAVLGVLCCRSGRLQAGIERLHAAHSSAPRDIAIAGNLVAALIEQKRLAEAYEIASEELSLADPSLRLAQYRGYLALSLGDATAAVDAYRRVVAADPSDFDSWNNLGNAMQMSGDAGGAVAALERALELDAGSAPVRLNLAAALGAAARPDEAERVLRRAAADFPGDPKPLRDLYLLLKRRGRSIEALPVLEEAARRDPLDSDLQLKLGIEYGLARRPAETERAFRAAIAGNPRLRDAYIGLAVHYEHSNRPQDLAPLAALASENGAGADALGFINALERRRAGDFAAGLDHLASISADIEPQRIAFLRGSMLDRLGRADEAFSCFSEGNRLHEDDRTKPLERARAVRRELAEQLERLTPEWAASWRGGPPPDDAADPAFIVGFPRSGTTLLDTMLMGHPGVSVMEEEPPLDIVEESIGGFDRIASLDPRAVRDARRLYLDEASRITGGRGGGLLVDKSPLFLSKVPLIHRLFPNARFILVLRHPCDVLLSCFMSNFRLNSGMSNFLRLEDAARFYDLTFSHWQKARAILPVSVHILPYERLIEDPEARLRALAGYLGLDWRDELLDHQGTATRREIIKTASYAQVTEPLYRRSVGRWQRYRRHLEPVLPILEPWVRKFGYSLD